MESMTSMLRLGVAWKLILKQTATALSIRLRWTKLDNSGLDEGIKGILSEESKG